MGGLGVGHAHRREALHLPYISPHRTDEKLFCAQEARRSLARSALTSCSPAILASAACRRGEGEGSGEGWLEIQGRYSGDAGEIRGDTGEIRGRYRGDAGEIACRCVMPPLIMPASRSGEPRALTPRAGVTCFGLGIGLGRAGRGDP